MAEFKLGRIRFVWKGDWASTTTYYKDDIVRNGGNTYICIAGHTAPSLFTTTQSTYWNKISDGIEWKADWDTSTYYKVNDIVKYGGYLYVCNAAHTSAATATLGLEDDLASWDLFAEGFDYKADWIISTRYKINDIVKYNGTIYICTLDHTSADNAADGLELDNDKWDIFSEGFFWRNDWTVSARYTRNDVVRYGGQLYVCNLGHTSAATAADGLEDDQLKWDYLHKGIEYKGDWLATTRYKINDVVKHGGGVWICVTYHTSQTAFTDDESKWDQFVEGLEFEDSWSSSVDYQPGDFVTYGGYSYVAITNHTNSVPTSNPTDWDLFTTGFRFVGDWDNLTEYLVGDVIRLGGYTYLCTDDHTGSRPPNVTYWQRLNSGIYWKDAWTDAAVYDAGDAVSHGVNSYICILAHTADETVDENRPDQDIAGTYWNILSGGAESGNLTTEGDIVYYGGSGPTRLAIGSVGQVLKVNSAGDAPEWGYFGQINNVYYVSTGEGTDEPSPTYGKTLDRPWKTVRYATEQVEKGAMRPNARRLLELNRSFIQAEVAAWVAAQITAGTGIWSGFVNDDPVKCARDMGQILDALIWDISHGGNERTRAATLSYFLSGSLIAAISDEDEQLVASINYMQTVIDAVLTNFDPAVVYQSPVVITQVKDTSLVEETDAQTLVNSLLSIITDAVTAAAITDIPAERIANNTIFVKTGEFAEVLPIIVPKNCAVVGDELRSTRIVPAGVLVDSADTPYSLAALARLKAVIGLAITAPGTITKTTGNALDPVTTRPVGSAGAGTAAQNLIQAIDDYIDFYINASGSAPTLTGSITPETSTDYTYAVESLEANREFLKAEIAAYIAFTFSGYLYDTAACARDVDRYLDAVKHDLIYTGNYRSLLAARYYVNAVTGSTLEDMFYLRNGTGLRNCTLSGLIGTLGAANAYGTKRPSAGAFASLDPGWGPAHTDAWITNKSPYVQNVTTFGTACVGLKVDGDLHAGGNDSIVANDFTQVISDGIGVWCTNLARTELVSVFSYYGHIGYLAENGGKIRATNGNSSYGDFGTVAEGVDDTETPISGNVTNQANDAVISSVFTDGNQILAIEYLNAGVGYTTATTAILTITGLSTADPLRTQGTYYGIVGTSGGSGTGQEFTVDIDEVGLPVITIVKGGTGHGPADLITIPAASIGGTGADVTFNVLTVGKATQFTVTGEGFGAVVNNAVISNGGVYEVRLLDPAENFGGDGYITSNNVAQGGDSTSITLSNTDSRLSTAYTGMAIYIVSGKGAGQYGYIQSYNSGTKVASVYADSTGTAGWDHISGGSIQTTLDETTTYSIEPRVNFADAPSALYADRAKGRATVEDNKIVKITIWNPGTGYLTEPVMTITDPNNTVDVPHEVRIGDGVLSQPTWTNRGTGFTTAQAEVTGDGYADLYQSGQYINAVNLSEVPVPGSNVTFTSIPGEFYKLVAVRLVTGAGPYSAQLQISPDISITDAAPHDDDIEIRIRYSQVRLTGHDFLDIGTGNFANTNYPGIPLISADPDKETVGSNGGRVFYTSTDQDGNFRVGRLFNVEQSTGVATLNADAFNISGLQELQLGAVELGGTGAVITEFSTDGTFTANSDNIVPTQKAIKTYIASQIGGGAGELNVNSITAGSIQISTNQITTTTGAQINIIQKVNYTGGISGDPVALNYFLLQ